MTRLFKLIVAFSAMAWLAFPLFAQDTSCYDVPDNLILNCGFETGNLTDWSIQPLYDPTTNKQLSASGIGVGDTNGLFDYAPANNGTHAATFGGPGQITQSITTTPGDNYEVSFYLNYSAPEFLDNFYANGNYPVTLPAYADFWLQSIVGFGVDTPPPCNSPGSNAFAFCQFTFTAVSTEADVSFGDLPCTQSQFLGIPQGTVNPAISCIGTAVSSGSPLYPYLLDDVSVVDCTQNASACGNSSGGGGGLPGNLATPEPGTMVLMLGGIGAFILIRRPRRMVRYLSLIALIAGLSVAPVRAQDFQTFEILSASNLSPSGGTFDGGAGMFSGTFTVDLTNLPSGTADDSVNLPMLNITTTADTAAGFSGEMFTSGDITAAGLVPVSTFVASQVLQEYFIDAVSTTNFLTAIHLVFFSVPGTFAGGQIVDATERTLGPLANIVAERDSIVRIAGWFFDFDGCQMAGHFSMFSSDRIFSAGPLRVTVFVGLLKAASRWVPGTGTAVGVI